MVRTESHDYYTLHHPLLKAVGADNRFLKRFGTVVGIPVQIHIYLNRRGKLQQVAVRRGIV